jgi:hypothetical protein
MNPRGRPHLKQRRTIRDLNLGARFAFTIIDVFAMWKAALETWKYLHPPLAPED